jgi:GNAT superfamily N-acetyltransferase
MTQHLSVQVEPWSEVIEEIKPFLPQHWAELALNKDSVPLDPNWACYAELDKRDVISVVTVRERERLVGYSIMFVAPGLHYQSCLDARMDIFWLAPEVRGRWGGVRLFKAVEKELRRRGVKRVYVGSKLHKDSSRLFLALGYEPIEQWFSKMLED